MKKSQYFGKAGGTLLGVLATVLQIVNIPVVIASSELTPPQRPDISLQIAQAPSTANDSATLREADNHYQQAETLIQVSSLSLAAYHFEAAARLYHTAGNPVGEKNSLIGLSFAQYRLTDYHSAQRYLHDADRVNTTSVPEAPHLRNRVNLIQGLVWLAQGKVSRAWPQLRQVQAGLLNDPVERNRLNLALGEIYRYTGQYSWALSTLQSTLNQSQDRTDRAKALGVIANIYYDLGDYDQAASVYEEALSQSRAFGDEVGTVRHLNGLGRVYLQQQDYDQAFNSYVEARDLAIALGLWRELGRILNNLGELYAEQGQLEKALEIHTEALSYTDNVGPDYSRSLNHLGQIYGLQQNTTEALRLYEESYRWAEGNQDQSGQINALSGVAEIHYQNGNLNKAKEQLYEALDQFEALNPGLLDHNKVSLFETQTYLYELLQQTLIDQGDPESALVVAERGRARAFAELLAVQAQETHPVPTHTPLTINPIKNLAQIKNTTFVQYSVIRQPSPGRTHFQDQFLYIWVIQPTGTIHFKQVDLTQQPQTLKDLISANQDSLGVRGFSPWFNGASHQLAQSPSSTHHNLKQLYTLLIEPIEQYLPDNDTEKVVFIPHRELFLIPFPALQDDQGQFLIEAHTLGSAPSLQTMDLLQQRSNNPTGEALVVGIDRETSPSAIIVGNPQMPSLPPKLGEPAIPLSNLPGAEAEAVAIAPLLNVEPLLGANATETAVRNRLTDADIIHLATHGLLDEQQGLSSAIALTPTASSRHNFGHRDQPDDGLLTAQEVMELNLKADLVVLSACNTGRGRITGDGVVGLSRAFLAAGAQNLVASLWAVPDEATAMLMTEFYQQLQTEPDKATALRQAMLTTMTENPDPRDWAAFFLIGL